MKKAKWIWENNEDNADEYANFYGSFNYAGGDKVFISLSCDSDYALFVNGKFTECGQYPDYPHYKVYDKLDITSCLHNGTNEFCILVWYYGAESSTYFKHKPGLIFEVSSNEEILTFSDQNTLCCKNLNYKNYYQKQITNQLGFSFLYDTRKFSENKHEAFLVDGFSKKLIRRPIKKLKINELTKGKLVDPKKRIYDLGFEHAGFLNIKFKAAEGEKIVISYGEHLRNGEVCRKIELRDFSVEIIGNGGFAEYTNPFRRLGARYLQIEAENNVEIEFIGLKETAYPDKIIKFKAKNALSQQIYDTCVRTLELCRHAHYEDTPWREQALYSLDSRNQMLCGYYCFKDRSFAKSNLKLISQDNRPDGLLSICFPSNMDLTIPSFSLYYIIAAEEYLKNTGDISFIKSILPKLTSILNVFINKIESGLVSVFHNSKNHWNFYEWEDGLSGNLFGEVEKHFDLILNCLLSVAISSFCNILSRANDSDRIKELAELKNMINNAVNARFFDAQKNIYKTFENSAHYSELGNALAILCGAADKGVSEKICKTLTGASDLIKTTLSMKGFKYDALLKTNTEKYKSFILNDIETNYSFMLKQGATSFWETIKGAEDFNGAGSLCHGWSAVPVYYYNILK